MQPTPALVAATQSLAQMAAARRRGLAAERRWLARPDVAALRAELMALGMAPPVGADDLAARLAPWLRDDDWWLAFLAEGCAAMRQEPLAAFPFRSLHGPAVHGLALLVTDRADVLLGVVDALDLPGAQDAAVLFSPTLSVIRVVRANGLALVRHRLDQPSGHLPRLHSAPPRRVADGAQFLVDNRCEAVTMVAADSDAVVLRITLRLPDRTPQRAFDLATGQLCATAMVDDRASRMLPLLPLARLAGQPSAAAPVLAQIAAHDEPALRWAAMREWLMADPVPAAAVLSRMAVQDRDHAVRRAAQAALAIVNNCQDVPCPA